MKKIFFLKFCLFLCLGFFFMSSARAQDDKKFNLDPSSDAPPTIDLGQDDDEEETAPTKKKRKKKVFYGIKTKKGFVRSGYGNNVRLEIFYYIKDYQEPDPFVRDVYWFDKQKRTIKSNPNIDKRYGRVLHGPYKKMADGEIVEEGIYYMGMKHGRWEKYDKNFNLLDKVKYRKGWPKDSKVVYYDEERSHLKEIIPIVHGETEGNYFMFHDNGQVAVRGEFQSNQRVGVWTEYFPNKRKKKELQFRPDPYDDKFVPHIIREWDDKGKALYDKYGKAKKSWW